MKTRKTKQSQIDELIAILNKKDSELSIAIGEKVKTEQYNKNWADGDKERRTEFAKAFNWKDGTAYNSGYKTPTWAEIFIQIGRLLNNDDIHGIRATIEGQRDDINRLSADLYNLQNPIK